MWTRTTVLNKENMPFLHAAEVVTLKQKGLYPRFRSKWRNEKETSQQSFVLREHCQNKSNSLNLKGSSVGTVHFLNPKTSF